MTERREPFGFGGQRPSSAFCVKPLSSVIPPCTEVLFLPFLVRREIGEALTLAFSKRRESASRPPASAAAALERRHWKLFETLFDSLLSTSPPCPLDLSPR